MYKLMIMLLLLGLVGLFVIKRPGGETFLSLDDFKPEISVADSVDRLWGEEQAERASGQPVQVYKWQDENGIWQFSNRAEDAAGAETMELDGVINTMPAVAMPEPATAAKPEKSAATSMPSLTTVPLSDAIETINQAKQLQQTIDDRKSELDKAIQPN